MKYKQTVQVGQYKRIFQYTRVPVPKKDLLSQKLAATYKSIKNINK